LSESFNNRKTKLFTRPYFIAGLGQYSQIASVTRKEIDKVSNHLITPRFSGEPPTMSLRQMMQGLFLYLQISMKRGKKTLVTKNFHRNFPTETAIEMLVTLFEK